MTSSFGVTIPNTVLWDVPLNPGIINTDMLQSCFGENADAYPTPERWAERAVPFILNLSPSDNGQPLTVD